jgi:hypothetical protein
MKKLCKTMGDLIGKGLCFASCMERSQMDPEEQSRERAADFTMLRATRIAEIHSKFGNLDGVGGRGAVADARLRGVEQKRTPEENELIASD